MVAQVEAAEELFEVLTHPSVSRRRVPILLACNKMDLETQAHSVDFVKRTLEKQVGAWSDDNRGGMACKKRGGRLETQAHSVEFV